MPPFSKSLEDEGVAIKTYKLVLNGIFQEEGIKELLLAPGKIKRRADVCICLCFCFVYVCLCLFD